MGTTQLGNLGYILALCISAIGSILGTSVAGMSALACWKKSFIAKKPAPFILIAFVGAPLSQTIYGMILMNAIIGVVTKVDPITALSVGAFGGLAIGLSAWFQGRAGAMAADALTSGGKGLGNYLMVLGIIETVALFVMVFLMTTLR